MIVDDSCRGSADLIFCCWNFLLLSNNPISDALLVPISIRLISLDNFSLSDRSHQRDFFIWRGLRRRGIRRSYCISPWDPFVAKAAFCSKLNTIIYYFLPQEELFRSG